MTLQSSRERSVSRVPFGDSVRQYQALQHELDAAAARVLKSGWYILGPEVQAFEAEFAQFCGVAHCVSVGNGTEALHLALRALGVQPGDEVVTVANAGVPGAVAVRQAGLTPRFADVDDRAHALSPGSLEATITPRTRAIMPVHLYGHPAPMAEIMAVAERHGLPVVEDCAQSHGATVGGRMTGTIGRLGCFSFYPTKNLGALGDGGAIVTDDAALADTLRKLRVYGWERKYHSTVAGGINSRLDELQAALLRCKLPHLTRWNDLRRERAAWYRELLGDVSGLTLPEDVAGHVYHLLVVQVHSGRRDALRQALTERGIGTDIHYPLPTHLQPAFEDLGYEPGELPVTERLAETVLSLPCFPELTRAEVEAVAAAIRDVMGQ
ncbi:MAG TPA: DegT/DnrJ/EryC1/StrS family aminotransferase [Herpetosiphonaceae bacterium]